MPREIASSVNSGTKEGTVMTQAERTELARRMDSYTVYNNNTQAVVTTGTFNDVEEYITNKQYTVVHDYSGYTVEE